jgi:NAD dependent epimerase/dehydratase family enzyme
VLAAQLHRPAITSVPRVALEVVLGGQLAREAVLASQRVAPTALLASGFTFSQPDIEAILKYSLSVHN